MNKLMICCFDKMMKEIGNPDNKILQNHPTNQFAQLEFEDVEGYRMFFSPFRSLIATISNVISSFFPELVLEFSFKKVAECLSLTKVADKDDINVNGNCTIQSYTYNKWENASTFLEWTFSNIKKENDLIIKNMKMIEAIMNMVLSFQTDVIFIFANS
jgi:hypothetical protein